MLAIGWFFYRRTENLSDYILGGRKLNAWVASMSAQASDMSGWLLMGLPGFAYVVGLESLWILIGLIAGTYANWKYVAKRLRVYTEIAGNAITLPDYFENRFRDDSKILRIVSAIFILIFFMIYTSSGFVAGAKLFSTVFGLSYVHALIIGVLVIISYTFLGGFLAVSWTDFFQGSLMFIAIALVSVFGFKLAGGIGGTIDHLHSVNPHLLTMMTDSAGIAIGTGAIISYFAWGLGYFGQPHILIRFMAIKEARRMVKARHIAMTWVIISLVGAVAAGMIGLVGLAEPLKDTDNEKVFMLLIELLFHPLIAGIFLSAILAAIMSTADSQLLVASSALTEDLYSVLLRRNASQRELVFISRIAVIIVAVIAFGIALNPESSVLKLVAYAWAGFGATFGPIVVVSLWWRRMTRTGALAGMLTGGITVIVWKNLSGGIFELYEMAPGFVLSLISVIAFSFLSAPSDEVNSEFDSVKSRLAED